MCTIQSDGQGVCEARRGGSSRSFALLLLVLLPLLPGCVVPSSYCCDGCKAKPPSSDQIVGIWLGYTEDELQFFRLDLHSDFTGCCASVYLPDTSLHQYGVHCYRIESWESKEGRLTFRLTAGDARAEPIFLKGTTSGHLMNLEVGGANWSRKLLLRPEANFTVPYGETKREVELIGK
jgi:hypothetical protein